MMSDPNAPDPVEPNPGQPPPPPQPPYQPAAPVAAVPLTESEDRQWASFAHLGGILGILPSLIIWLVFRDRGRFTAVEAKEALNFQITLLIGYVAINILSAILAAVTFGIGGTLSLLLLVLWILGLVFSILGFNQAKDGQHYQYPFNLRLIK